METNGDAWPSIDQLRIWKSYQMMIHSAVLQQFQLTKLTWHGGNCVKWKQMARRGHQLWN
eukprot:scaffold131094_cov53-Cyclotella_meneghiniana.AAC.1